MLTRTCSVDGCDRPHHARSGCTLHYQAQKRQGVVNAGQCSVDGCDRPPSARGMCNMHYLRVRKTGSPYRNEPTAEDRFWSKVRKSDGCWTWTGSVNPTCYGRLGSGGKRGPVVYAHRFAYELLVGPIPKGLVLDHLCRNPPCVNPDHLEAVTQRENVLRGISSAADHARQTHCKRGHEFTDENTYVTPRGWRICRTCKRAKDRRLWSARSAKKGKATC